MLRHLRTFPFVRLAFLRSRGRGKQEDIGGGLHKLHVVYYRRGHDVLVEIPEVFKAHSLDAYVALSDALRNNSLYKLIPIPRPNSLENVVFPLIPVLRMKPFCFEMDGGKGVYAMVVCRRQNLVKGCEVGFVVIKLGESGKVDNREDTHNKAGNYGELGCVVTLWYIRVRGEGSDGAARRKALEKLVRKKMEDLKLTLPKRFHGEFRKELFQMLRCQMAMVQQAYLAGYDEWLLADGHNLKARK